MSKKVVGDRAFDWILGNKFCIAAILFILVEPPLIARVSILNTIFRILTLLILILVCVILISKRHRTESLLWIVLFFSTILISTIVNGGDVVLYAKEVFPILTMCLVFELWTYYEPKKFVSAFWILELLVIVNLAMIIFIPNGLYSDALYSKNWLLGYKNVQIRTILPVLTMVYIKRGLSKRRKINLEAVIFTVVSAASVFLLDSSTSIIGLCVFLVMYFLVEKSKIFGRVVSLFNAFCVVFLAGVSVAVFHIQEYFTDFLGKDVTFHTRTRLWERGIACIQSKPLLGYGYLSSTGYQTLFKYRYYTHPHNLVMYLLMQGGIVLLGVFVYGVAKASRTLHKNKSTASNAILACLCAFFVMGITESITNTVLFYPMIVFAMQVSKINTSIQEELESK